MPSRAIAIGFRPGYFVFSVSFRSREDMPISAVFSPADCTPTPEPPPETWTSA